MLTVPVRVGAAAAVILGLLAACGEDDDDEALSPFCQEVDDINEAFESSDDLAGFGEALEDMEVAPPEEIEEYWELVLDNWDELVRVEAGEDDDAADGEEVEDEAGEDEAADDAGEDQAGDEPAAEDDVATDVSLDPEFDVAARVVTSYLRDVCTLPIPER